MPISLWKCVNSSKTQRHNPKPDPSRCPVLALDFTQKKKPDTSSPGRNMATRSESAVLDLPRIYLIRMSVFLLVVAILVAILFPQVQRAFTNAVGLNGFIVLVLLFGIAHAFLQVARLWPEVSWVNSFRIADPGYEVPHTPRLLAPMALVGRTALSVEIRIKWETAVLRAASITARVACTLLATPAQRFASTMGTCL